LATYLANDPLAPPITGAAIIRTPSPPATCGQSLAYLLELGKVRKTIFLCKYLNSEALRQEIKDGLNVIENWNSANDFIWYGKGGENSTNNKEEQEIAILALHLLQICMVYINTLLVQKVLSEKE
jgi:TnpA family transposase